MISKFLIESGVLFDITRSSYLEDFEVKFDQQHFGKIFEPFLVILVLFFRTI